MVLLLVGLDEERQEIEAIGFGSSLPGFLGEEAFDLAQGRLVFCPGSDGAVDQVWVLRASATFTPITFFGGYLRKVARWERKPSWKAST